MMRPEQIKKFCSCCCFLFGGQHQNNIKHILLYLLFTLLCRPIQFLVETPHSLSALQGYAAILSFAQLSIIASPLFLCFPFFHLISFHSQDKKRQDRETKHWHNLRFFSLIAVLLKTTFVAVVTVDQANQHFCKLRQLEGLLGDRGTRMQTKLNAWQAPEDCWSWSTEFKECYKIK